MVSAAEITNEASLRTWLETCEPPAALAVAARAALRVAPLLRRNDLSNLAILRLILAGAVAAQKPSERTLAALRNARQGLLDLKAHQMPSGLPVYYMPAEMLALRSVEAVLEAADVPAAAWMAVSAQLSLLGEGQNPQSVWELHWNHVFEDTRATDTREGPFRRRLWPGGGDFGSAWVSTPETRDLGGGHVFWADWYEGYLTGQPLDIDLLEKVALIESAEWDKGDDHVNGIIAGYYRDFRLDRAIRQTPYSLRVEFNGQKGKLEAFAVDTVDAPEVESRVRQAMKDFTARCRADRSPNGMLQILGAACGDPIRDLRRDLSRYKDNVVGLYDSLMAAQKALHQVAAANGMEREANLLRLVDTIDNCAKDLSGSAPALLDVLRRRASVDLARVRQEQMQMMVRLCTGMKQDSDGYLEFACQIALTAILSSTDEEERQSAWMFMEAMVPRGARAMIAAHEGDEPKRRMPLGQRIKGAADVLGAADKIGDIGQELAQELPGWVQAAAESVGKL